MPLIKRNNLHLNRKSSIMLSAVHPKLPMRSREVTRDYYIKLLQFTETGTAHYPDYLMLKKDDIEIHFFLFESLSPGENYGQIYFRVSGIETYYRDLMQRGIPIHPNAPLQTKPWGQMEFSLLDPDYNLLTFGEAIK